MNTDNEFGKYKIKQNQQVGQGFSGLVMGCEDTESPDQKLCAKMMHKKQEKYSIREKVISEALKKHFKTYKNLVQIVDVIDTPKSVVIILELCEKDLEQIFKDKDNQFSLQECLDIIRQIINGYRKLIDLSLIHRDLKPQNILYKDGYYKITDFGFAIIVDSVEEQKKYTQLGTPSYSSPQILLGQQYSNKTDIYSLGLMFYRLIFGKYLFQTNQHHELIEMIKKTKSQPIQIEMIEGMTDELKQLVESMLKFEENDRIGWQDLIKHPLINLDSQCILKKWRKEDRLENIELQSERDNNLYFTTKFLQYNFSLTIICIKNLKESTISIKNELIKSVLFLIKCLLEHILYGINDSTYKFMILQEKREVEVIEEVFSQQMLLENQNEIEQIQPDEGVYISQIQQFVYQNHYLFYFDKQQIYFKEHLQILYFLNKIVPFTIIKFIDFFKFCKQIYVEQKNLELMESYLEKINVEQKNQDQMQSYLEQ